MRVLIVIGAGASYDSWPDHIAPQILKRDDLKIPLANDLFAPLPTQNKILSEYNLMGLAGYLRSQARSQGRGFNVEAELADINNSSIAQNDLNDRLNLFKARFYIHRLIVEQTEQTLNYTSSHTIYIDLLNKLRRWINEKPESRFIDIVSFNYDDLLERAMQNVYGHDWQQKMSTPLTAYYGGRNLKIYKPHGSINWARSIVKKDGGSYSYSAISSAFENFNGVRLGDEFIYVQSNHFIRHNSMKEHVPAIAIPFREKTDFQECPQDMFSNMLTAVEGADKLITIGWRGADAHFTKLLEKNRKINEVHVVSRSGSTKLDELYSGGRIRKWESTFSHFTASPTLESILANIESMNGKVI
jgi:hypothetical protein